MWTLHRTLGYSLECCGGVCFGWLQRSKTGELSKSEKAKIERDFQTKVRGPLTRLLDFAGGNVSVIHKSMDDFLRGSEDAKSNRLDVDVGVGHEMIANAAKQTVFPLQTWKNINDYTSSQTFLVSHGLFHFVQDASSTIELQQLG